jgi:hypothetical protein
MAVSIHYVNVGLVKVDASGNVISKDDPSTTIRDVMNSSTEHRVIPRTTGPASSANSAGYPTVAQYLALEAAADHALAYMDQSTIVTQQIT